MQVRIPTPLHSYTGGRSLVDARGRSLQEVVDHLDRQFPGIRFRIVDEQGAIREHIRFYVGTEMARGLDVAVTPEDEVMIVAALSGG
jgi:molybdopterin converting factor small subunit